MSRHSFDAPVVIERAGTDDTSPEVICDAWALDFTVIGAVLLLERPMTTGEELLINLAPGGAQPERVSVHVVACDRLVGSIHRMRVRFK